MARSRQYSDTPETLARALMNAGVTGVLPHQPGEKPTLTFLFDDEIYRQTAFKQRPGTGILTRLPNFFRQRGVPVNTVWTAEGCDQTVRLMFRFIDADAARKLYYKFSSKVRLREPTPSATAGLRHLSRPAATPRAPHSPQ